MKKKVLRNCLGKEESLENGGKNFLFIYEVESSGREGRKHTHKKKRFKMGFNSFPASPILPTPFPLPPLPPYVYTYILFFFLYTIHSKHDDDDDGDVT